jgi:hypothetical protein
MVAQLASAIDAAHSAAVSNLFIIFLSEVQAIRAEEHKRLARSLTQRHVSSGWET